ncbi:hypothetical protein PR202_ga24394 [Eleusine coracana subsp. coracana]|uniref:F-box domain-containing protein n=1 Tax=Eleusine coracana subsp. coracana TaxID=191504 RepID=A0AAV5D945_ELECO|nr:hypothetical protein PR202_ga24394 [Eleusine coracana subsp. coracana]
MPIVLLRRLVDEDEWEAEDLAGRLGIVAHAAFLRAGFVPCGEEPSSGHLLKQVDEIGPSAPALRRRYTAAQLARREGDAVDAAVLELRARGNGGVAFQAFVLTRDGDRRRLCEAVLDAAALAPLLSGGLADAARALLETGAWLWRPLADWVVPTLLLELCRRNDLPVTGFTSLPDDAKVEILKRLDDGKDLAMVECVSSQLRRLVADRGLWKAMYRSLGLPSDLKISQEVGSWKERYVNSRPQLESGWDLPSLLCDSDNEYDRYLNMLIDECRLWEFEFPMPRENLVILPPMRFTSFSYPSYMVHDDPPAPLPEREVAPKSKNAGRQHRKVQRNHYQKKQHGVGAIHSPSSRYKWKHR